jgi:hypothetical protein
MNPNVIQDNYYRCRARRCSGLCSPCASTITRWAKPGASYDGFLKDRYACIQDARSHVSNAYIDAGRGSARSGEIIRSDIYNACMAARGYREDPNGFAPPPGGAVRMTKNEPRIP